MQNNAPAHMQHTLQYKHISTRSHTNCAVNGIRFTVYSDIGHFPGGKMCLCPWQKNVLPRLTVSQTQHEAGCVFVPVALLWTDTCRTAATFRAFPSNLHHYLFTILHAWLSRLLCVSILMSSPRLLLCPSLYLPSILWNRALSPFFAPVVLFSSFPSFHAACIRLAPLSHSILYWLVSLCVLWPCCNSAREVTADRFLWKRHCHVR